MHYFNSVQVLKKYDNWPAAKEILERAATEVSDTMRHFGWEVPILQEIDPQVESTLGLNYRNGARISIRVREMYDPLSFIDYTEIMDSFLHELAHNLHNEHARPFNDLLYHLRNRHSSYYFVPRYYYDHGGDGRNADIITDYNYTPLSDDPFQSSSTSYGGHNDDDYYGSYGHSHWDNVGSSSPQSYTDHYGESSYDDSNDNSGYDDSNDYTGTWGTHHFDTPSSYDDYNSHDHSHDHSHDFSDKTFSFSYVNSGTCHDSSSHYHQSEDYSGVTSSGYSFKFFNSGDDDNESVSHMSGLKSPFFNSSFFSDLSRW
ncbi:hypothetical protein H4219_005444 [Mycoemilia scoparia]|uniref:WLM domain-containing protein n=1 Tax=Mycoemilia scoparia TaxID=417184 RepID=A0A9W7ZTW6_9FUNG|nr:hypothetical protein H4219_005444 [Mycoemilia scoparia]